MRWKSFKFNIIQSAGKFIFNGTQRKKTMKLNYLVEGWREGKKNNGGPSAAAIRPRAELRTGLYMEPTFELPLVFSTGDGPPKPCGTWQKRWRRKSQDVGGGGRGRTSLLVIEGARRTQLTVWWVQSTPPASSPPSTDTQKRTHLPEHLN